jgi:hypothetical protein
MQSEWSSENAGAEERGALEQSMRAAKTEKPSKTSIRAGNSKESARFKIGLLKLDPVRWAAAGCKDSDRKLIISVKARLMSSDFN